MEPSAFTQDAVQDDNISVSQVDRHRHYPAAAELTEFAPAARDGFLARYVAEVAKLFPSATVVTIASGGHFPWLDNPIAWRRRWHR